MQIRDRIKEFKRVPAKDLEPNPKNWRTHSKAQENALRCILADVGYADALRQVFFTIHYENGFICWNERTMSISFAVTVTPAIRTPLEGPVEFRIGDPLPSRGSVQNVVRAWGKKPEHVRARDQPFQWSLPIAMRADAASADDLRD